MLIMDRPWAARVILLWALLTSFSEAFVLQFASPQRTPLYHSSTTSDFLTFESHDAKEKQSLQIETDKLLKASKLPDAAGQDAIPLLSAWAREETVEAAQQAQKVLDRLLQEEQSADLTSKHFTIVMDAWGRAGRPQKAEKLYHDLIAYQEKLPDNSCLAPSPVTWNVLLLAQIRSGNTAQAEYWLGEMENKSQPRTVDYNLLLSAYAQEGRAQTAEQTIKQMVDRCKAAEGDCLCAPNLLSYTLLLEAHSNSAKEGSGTRALDILEALQQQPEELGARPYAAVIQAMLADPHMSHKLTREKAEELYQIAVREGMDSYMDKLQMTLLNAYVAVVDPIKAELLLAEMEDRGTANIVAYNRVLFAWKISNVPDSVERAEAVLERMEKRSLTDCISYTTFIGSLASQGTKASAVRANEILDSMLQQYQKEKNTASQPNTHMWNNVILAWARSGNAERAEQVLNRMEGENVEPNVVSYSTVMDGWAKSRDRDAAAKVEAIFQRMQKMYEKGNSMAKPNLVSYVTLINAYANDRDGESAQKAQDALFQMYKEYMEGNTALKPNTQIISAVIEAWQKSGRRDAGEYAEKLLDWMVSVYQDQKDDSLRPNEYSFSSTIAAWSKSRKVGKSTHARKVLNRMKELKQSGVLDVSPNTYCYTAVINS